MTRLSVLSGRPLCIGACILLLYLLLLRSFGVPDEISRARRGYGAVFPWQEKQMEEENSTKEEGRDEPDPANGLSLDRQLQRSEELGQPSDLTGFIRKIQKSDQSTRLFLSHFSVIRSDTLSIHPADEDYMVMVYLKGDLPPDIHCGDAVLVRGLCMLPEEVTVPGQFNMNAYLISQNVIFIVRKAAVLRKANLKSSLGFLQKISDSLSNSFDRILPHEDAGMMKAILLGDKTAIDPEQKRLYQDGGLIHLTAISGLHVNLIGMTLYALLRRRRFGFLLSSILSGSLLFIYCLMTGMSVSALRALIMFLVWTGAQILGRTYDILTAASFAAVVVMLRKPACISQGSFWLSFSCILSMALILPPMDRAVTKIRKVKRTEGRLTDILLPRRGRAVEWRNIHYLMNGLKSRTHAFLWEIIQKILPAVSIQLGTLPLSAWFYYQCTPFSFIANLIALPFMSSLAAAGIFSCILGTVSTFCGRLAAGPCHYILQLFSLLSSMETHMPFCVFVTGRPKLWQVLVYYFIVSVLLLDANGIFYEKIPREKRLREKGGAGTSNLVKKSRRCFQKPGFGIAGAMLVLLLRSPVPFETIFIDVGQGDSILIHQGSALHSVNFLVDGGSSTQGKVWTYRLEGMLKFYGIRKLDGIFLTHGDLDHVNGIEEMLLRYKENSFGQGTGGITVGWIGISGPVADRNLEMKLAGGQMERSAGLKFKYPGKGEHTEKDGEDVLDERPWNITQMAAKAGIPAVKIYAGQEIRSKYLTIRCLYPSEKDISEELNQNSLVFLLNYRGNRILLTGDLEKESEQTLLKTYGKSLHADILKAGHHGSRNATGYGLLEAVRPAAVIISCGKNNRYGHPAQEMLNRLENERVLPVRTDELGTVAAITDKGKLKIVCLSCGRED